MKQNKLLSFQPYPLYINGGGARLLRRLYEGHEQDVISLCIWNDSFVSKTGEIQEIIIPQSPLRRPWMRWFIRDLASWLRTVVFRSMTIRRIRNASNKVSYDILHVVNHGSLSAILCKDTFITSKQLWVSFHDHYSTVDSSFGNTQALWNKAQRRLVISKELGNEYCRLFGKLKYEIITDGIATTEISTPYNVDDSEVIVYFAGLLHIDYLPLFKILADVLDVLVLEGKSCKLVLRGTQQVSFLKDRKFNVEFRSNFIDDSDIKKELDCATLYYLPMKFTEQNFYHYSLSTKMVSYLGGSGAILYHGPKDSAASQMLNSAKAAECCYNLETGSLYTSITNLLNRRYDVSLNAKVLAQTEFELQKIQSRFWQENSFENPAYK